MADYMEISVKLYLKGQLLQHAAACYDAPTLVRVECDSVRRGVLLNGEIPRIIREGNTSIPSSSKAHGGASAHGKSKVSTAPRFINTDSWLLKRDKSLPACLATQRCFSVVDKKNINKVIFKIGEKGDTRYICKDEDRYYLGGRKEAFRFMSLQDYDELRKLPPDTFSKSGVSNPSKDDRHTFVSRDDKPTPEVKTSTSSSSQEVNKKEVAATGTAETARVHKPETKETSKIQANLADVDKSKNSEGLGGTNLKKKTKNKVASSATGANTQWNLADSPVGNNTKKGVSSPAASASSTSSFESISTSESDTD